MTNFNDFLNEQMKDPEFKAEWDALDPEFAVIEATELLRYAPCSGWLPVWGCGSRSNLFRQSEPPSRWPAGCLLF